MDLEQEKIPCWLNLRLDNVFLYTAYP